MTQKISVTKVFNAQVEMVWKLWVEPELVKRWWGPQHFTSPVALMDFREKGRSLVSMKAPKELGGREWYSIWEYIEITPFTTIEFMQMLADEKGNETDPVTVGMPPDFPREVRTIVTFKKMEDQKTEMTVTEYADFGSISNFAKTGLEQCVEKMGAIYS